MCTTNNRPHRRRVWCFVTYIIRLLQCNNTYCLMFSFFLPETINFIWKQQQHRNFSNIFNAIKRINCAKETLYLWLSKRVSINSILILRHIGGEGGGVFMILFWKKISYFTSYKSHSQELQFILYLLLRFFLLGNKCYWSILHIDNLFEAPKIFNSNDYIT